MSTLSIEEIFSHLGLQSSAPNPGVYNGKWSGSGDLLTSKNPATGTILGTVQSGTVDEYENTIKLMRQAKKNWMETLAPIRGEDIITDLLFNIKHLYSYFMFQ
jgi:aldehyde dehydrogenase family 7 member A1